MSNYLVKDTALSYEAARIRAKTGSAAQITFDGDKGFGDAIDAIQTGGGGYDISSVNILDGVGVHAGYIKQNGEIAGATASKEMYTDLVEIPSGSTQLVFWAINTGGSPWTCVAFYDSSQAFVSRPTTASLTGQSVPSNAAYFRFTMETKGDCCYAAFASPLVAINAVKSTMRAANTCSISS